MSATPVSVRGVSKWYGRVIGLNGVDLEVTPGITGLLGPNGAGKSTLIKLMTGQLRPSIGEVKVFGRSVSRCASARRLLGYAPEVDAFYEEMSAGGFVLAMARLCGLPRALARRRTAEALARCGIAAEAEKGLKACSKGTRQRVKVAQALVHEPSVLVLDEPLNGVDPTGRKQLLELFRGLRAEGKTILFSTHILHEVEAIADRIVLVARGRILAQGTLSGVRAVLSDHPLTVRLRCSRPRRVGARLLETGVVAAVEVDVRGDRAGPEGLALGDAAEEVHGDVTVRVSQPDFFFASLADLVLAEGARLERLEPLDASAEAVFAYLVDRSGCGWEGARL